MISDQRGLGAVSCCLPWVLAGRRKPVSDMKGLLVDSVTFLGCQASVPPPSLISEFPLDFIPWWAGWESAEGKSN